MFDLGIISSIAKPANSWFESLSKRKNQLNEIEIEAIKAFYAIFYNNIIVNSVSSGFSEIVIQPHKGFVRDVKVFNNSIVSGLLNVFLQT